MRANKFTNVIFNATIKEKELVNKSDVFEFIDNSDLDNKIVAKPVLKAEQEKIVKFQAFDLIFF